MFGLVEIVGDKIKLTELGFEAIDTDDARSTAARVTAFLNVPLFERTYTEFRNRQLPPRPAGLEQAFVGFGVLETRRLNARWTFDRSARFAGFFASGDDRLIAPIVGTATPSNPKLLTEQTPPPVAKEPAAAKLPPAAAFEPLVKGLLDRLPLVGKEWSLNDRAWWLRALAMNLAIVYGKEGEGEIAIKAPNLHDPASPKANAPPTPIVEKETRSTPQAKAAPRVESGGWDDKVGGDLDDEIPF